MKDFNYAHKDTSEGERRTATAQFNSPDISEELEKMRKSAFEREIPVSDDETLNFLCTLCAAIAPSEILELGTAVGISGAAMLFVCKAARLTTVERDPAFSAEAEENFKKLNLSDRVTLISGDAGEVIEKLDKKFDFIFLDSAKAQYVKYLPDLKRLLRTGGTLFADDVLLFGYVTGEEPTPKKRKMLVEHVKEYLNAAISDGELYTTVLNVGNGVALSVKK